MFDPRDPFERCYWHYDSRRPLSMAQLIQLGSIDPETAALVWLMLEKGASFTIAGPTDPRPGAGKTTVLNAVFQFLPQEATLVYTCGCYEDFAFAQQPGIDPSATYVLSNEISDHQPFYMWGRVARHYLMLAAQGFRIATSVHADTIDDVIYLYQRELRLSTDAIRHLGLIVNIGLIGEGGNPLRRWLSVYFLQPQPDPANPHSLVALPLSRWNGREDAFEHCYKSNLDILAGWAGLTPDRFISAVGARNDCLQELARAGHTSMDQMYVAINELRKQDLVLNGQLRLQGKAT